MLGRIAQLVPAKNCQHLSVAGSTATFWRLLSGPDWLISRAELRGGESRAAVRTAVSSCRFRGDDRAFAMAAVNAGRVTHGRTMALSGRQSENNAAGLRKFHAMAIDVRIAVAALNRPKAFLHKLFAYAGW